MPGIILFPFRLCGFLRSYPPRAKPWLCMGYRSAVRGSDSGIILFSFRLCVFLRSYPPRAKPWLCMGYRSAVRGSDSGDHSFFFSSLRLSPVITTTGKTVAMHGLPLCGSGERFRGLFFFLFVFASFSGHYHHGQNRGYAWVTALRFGGVIPGIILFSFRLCGFLRS